jgi:hypothetical protein
MYTNKNGQKESNFMHNNILTIKLVGISLTKEVKNVYTKNHKTLLRKIREINGKIISLPELKDTIL